MKLWKRECIGSTVAWRQWRAGLLYLEQQLVLRLDGDGAPVLRMPPVATRPESRQLLVEATGGQGIQKDRNNSRASSENEARLEMGVRGECN